MIVNLLWEIEIRSTGSGRTFLNLESEEAVDGLDAFNFLFIPIGIHKNSSLCALLRSRAHDIIL